MVNDFPPEPKLLVAYLCQALSEFGQSDHLSSGESRRLFHGRGGRFSGYEFICVDIFNPVILITVYRDPGEAWLAHLLAEIMKSASWTKIEMSPFRVQKVFVQRRDIQTGETSVLWQSEMISLGTPSSDIVFALEQGLRYELDLYHNRNHGFFLDMANGRRWVKQHAKGRRVLNLFAYTCSFSVVAMAGEAEGVINVDMSSHSLSVGRRNHLYNDLHSDKVRYLKLNIMQSWGRLKRLGPFGLIIIDPPSYQKGSFEAERDYPKIIRRLPELLAKGGDVLACLNAPYLGSEHIKDSFTEHFDAAQLRSYVPPARGFENLNKEEGLKILHYHLPDCVRVSQKSAT